MNINTLYLSSIFLLSGCVYDPPSGFINIHNYSDSAVYVYETMLDSLPCDQPLQLFQTLGGNAFDVRGNPMKDTISPGYRVNAFAYGEIRVWGKPDKPTLPYNEEKINLFFIKESIMRTNTWEEICGDQLYSRKMVLTELELDSMDWVVTYTP